MLTAIARPYSALPLSLIERHHLGRLAHERGGEKELQFHFAAGVPLLPGWHEGQLRVVRSGCRRGESRVMPLGGVVPRLPEGLGADGGSLAGAAGPAEHAAAAMASTATVSHRDIPNPLCPLRCLATMATRRCR